MAPTIFAFKGQRTPAKLLKEIKALVGDTSHGLAVAIADGRCA